MKINGKHANKRKKCIFPSFWLHVCVCAVTSCVYIIHKSYTLHTFYSQHNYYYSFAFFELRNIFTRGNCFLDFILQIFRSFFYSMPLIKINLKKYYVACIQFLFVAIQEHCSHHNINCFVHFRRMFFVFNNVESFDFFFFFHTRKYILYPI